MYICIKYLKISLFKVLSHNTIFCLIFNQISPFDTLSTKIVLIEQKSWFETLGHSTSLCRRCKIVWKLDRKSHPVTATVYKIDLMSFMFVCLMAFNATFNNISVISWQSVLSEDPEKTTNLSQVTYKLDHSKVL